MYMYIMYSIHDIYIYIIYVYTNIEAVYVYVNVGRVVAPVRLLGDGTAIDASVAGTVMSCDIPTYAQAQDS